MIATWCFVIGVIVFYKLRRILRQWVNHATSHSKCSVLEVGRASFCPCLSCRISLFFAVICVKVSISVYSTHVIHGYCRSSLDARVLCCCIQSDSAPTANANDGDSTCIYIISHAEIIYSCQKVFRIDVGRSRTARFARRFACIRRVESDGDESTLCHGLCIETWTLLLRCSERTAHGNGRQLSFSVLRNIEVGSNSKAVLGLECYFLMVYLLAVRKSLVPILY